MALAPLRQGPLHDDPVIAGENASNLALVPLGQEFNAHSGIISDILFGSGYAGLGILGRIYKDRFDDATKAGDRLLAKDYLRQAIDAYLRGFETDWRDAYPGVNAVTLMEIADPPDPRRVEILPVVRYSVQRKIAAGKPDYWDYATLIELAVLANDQGQADAVMPHAVGAIREKWEPETTARNLGLIRAARELRGAAPAWATEIEDDLRKRAA